MLLSNSPKPALVLLHGWGSHSGVWSTLRAQLAEDFEIFAPDLRCAPDGANWLNSVKNAPERAVWVGWSLGGLLAIEFASRFPERVLALATIACNPCFTQRGDWPCAISEQRFNRFSAEFASDPERVVSRFHALINHGQPPSAQRRFKQLIAGKPPLRDGLLLLKTLDTRARLAALSMPCLHICGGKDALAPKAFAERLPPHQRVLLLQKAGHAPQIGAPRAVAEALRCFWMDHFGKQVIAVARRRLSAAFSRSAKGYEAAATLQHEIAGRLLKQLPDVASRPPKRVLDLGCGTGFAAHTLMEQVGKERMEMIGVDVSIAMLRRAQGLSALVCADFEALPFRQASAELLLANMAAHWSWRREDFLAEAWRTLQSGGELLFSVPIADTLSELRWASRFAVGGPRVNRFASAQDWRDACIRQQFEVVATEICWHRRYYARLRDLLMELKLVGVASGGAAARLSRHAWRRVGEAYDMLRVQDKGLPVTWQIAYWRLRKP